MRKEDLYIKVCGITQIEDALALSDTGISHIGFIFYEKSARFVHPQTELNLLKNYSQLQKVGVFVNANRTYIEEQIHAYGLDMIQLHGEESVAFCRDLQQRIPVMKAFKVKDEKDLAATRDYTGSCDYFLFDAAGQLYGGNGITFNWDILGSYAQETPFFLSGGIGLAQTGLLKNFNHPAWRGIDVNSRFEIRPGRKDIQKINQFLEELEQDE